jgi:hypothetical protein
MMEQDLYRRVQQSFERQNDLTMIGAKARIRSIGSSYR